ncbi:prealbumin-like fold domain-containing protein [Massilia sp. H-1]|nr:prealbumin-like fold domain-containing protein [Massilia sp. H-1]
MVFSGPARLDPATHLVGGATVQTQVTGSDGAYQYLLQNGYPSGTYTLAVTAAPSGYSTLSAQLPPCSATLVVGAAPDPAFIQASDTAAGQRRPGPRPGRLQRPGGGRRRQHPVLSASADQQRRVGCDPEQPYPARPGGTGHGHAEQDRRPPHRRTGRRGALHHRAQARR